MKERLLIATSNPDFDRRLKYLGTELKAIRDVALRKNNIGSRLAPEEAVQIHYQLLEERLAAQKQITMLHYIGHSTRGGLQGDFIGQETLVTDENFTNILKTSPHLKLVFLNSCCSSAIAGKILDETQIPYVIGTSANVRDDLAAAFAFLFYGYLGDGLTVEDAFDRVTDKMRLGLPEFTSILKDINKDLREADIQDTLYKERGFVKYGNGSDDKSEKTWKLFRNDKITPEQVSWTLFPRFNLRLSRQENKDRLKIFCIYDTSCLDIYNEIRSLLTEIGEDSHSQQERIQNGLFELHDQEIEKLDETMSSPFAKALKAEFESADFVLHFLNGTFYTNLVNDYNLQALFELAPRKRHIFLPVQKPEASFDQYSWFSGAGKEAILTRWTTLSAQFKEYQSYTRAFREAFREDYEKKIIPEEIFEAIERIPFIQAVRRYRQSHHLFYSYIRCTKACGEAMLINHIRNNVRVGISRNTPNYLVSCQNEEGHILIRDTADLWRKLWHYLEGDEFDPEVDDTNRASKCASKMMSRLPKTDVVIIFDGIYNDELYQSIRTELWQTLVSRFPAFSERYSKEKGLTLEKKLYLFIINREDQWVPESDPFEETENIIPYAPLAPFSDDDYDLWVQQPSFPEVLRLRADLNVLYKSEPYRKNLISKILEGTPYSYLLTSVEQKLLTLR